MYSNPFNSSRDVTERRPSAISFSGENMPSMQNDSSPLPDETNKLIGSNAVVAAALSTHEPSRPAASCSATANSVQPSSTVPSPKRQVRDDQPASLMSQLSFSTKAGLLFGAARLVSGISYSEEADTVTRSFVCFLIVAGTTFSVVNDTSRGFLISHVGSALRSLKSLISPDEAPQNKLHRR